MLPAPALEFRIGGGRGEVSPGVAVVGGQEAAAAAAIVAARRQGVEVQLRLRGLSLGPAVALLAESFLLLDLKRAL